ncbi:MAG: dynamin family protein, partial [Chloroflexota bacterium]
NSVPPSPTEALREPAAAAASLASCESDALLALLDRAAAREPIPLARVLATGAALRMRLLEAGSEEAAGWWDTLAEGERSLYGSLIDALRAASPSTQERVVTYLRELAATGSPAFVPLREPLAQTDLVVAVAGDFKRGKSTLLNALIGRHLLPTRVAPATAVPCVLHYAEGIEIRVHYRDGRPAESIAEEDLESYACIPRPSDREELAFRPEIDHLEIGVPWSFPCDVALLDLPGLNEEGGRAEMARLAVAGADAVLVVLAATQLLAEDELQFIDALWGEGQRTLLFAVNHLDQLDGSDLVLVHERAITLLAPYRGILGQTIFLVSARQAGNAIAEGMPPPPESGLPPLLVRLERLLGPDRGAVWRVGRARQALAALEEHDRAAGDAVLEQQD